MRWLILPISLAVLAAAVPADSLADRLYTLPHSAYAPTETSAEYQHRMRTISNWRSVR